MLHSRQPHKFGLFGLVLALYLVHVSPSAQAGAEPRGCQTVASL